MNPIRYIQSFTFYKILNNSIPMIFKKQVQVDLGRWSRCSSHHSALKVTYTNMDHCGDYICGSPEVLKKMYPKHKNM